MDRRKSAETGKFGEEYTAKYLLENGYEIVKLNYHSQYGEIDIITKKDGVLSFVEVKTRSKGYMYEPVYAVSRQKREKIIKTAYCYIMETEYDGAVSFDVALLVVNGDRVEQFKYMENAFEAIF